MKLCVLIIVSGLMCLGACKMVNFILDVCDRSLVSILGVLLFVVLGIVSGAACVVLSYYGIYIYLRDAALMGV